ncbi:MAG: alkaline phosphatase family protein, partial [Actinomycetota bacterium]|nr:alkaline phosphatase family protein [Actinomycetota bacterium]
MPPRNTSFRLLASVLVLAIAGLSVFLAVRDEGGGEGENGTQAAARLGKASAKRIHETNDAIERGCGLDKDILARVWRGWVPGRSFELILVPQAPNYPGSFEYTGHSGPWDYLQNIPLVFYGSGIAANGVLEEPASLADVYPTAGSLLNTDLPPRSGRALTSALPPEAEAPPKVIVTVVWDGVGRNVLELWPDAWPNLKRLENEGTSYLNASLGSSPSITPATHTTLGTGAYPRDHGIPGIEMRKDDGTVGSAFIDRDPKDMELTSFGDEYDLAMGNAPIVGMVGWKTWHLGMLGHGTQTPGGDADQFGILGGKDGDITGNDTFYSTPPYLP